MNDEVSKQTIIGFSIIFIAMVVSMLYGLFLVKQSQPDNCWSQYTTENEAIINCEGANK